MGEVVNLNKRRKRKAREEKRRRAEKNRLEHGMTKAEKARGARERERADKHLDGHKLDE